MTKKSVRLREAYVRVRLKGWLAQFEILQCFYEEEEDWTKALQVAVEVSEVVTKGLLLLQAGVKRKDMVIVKINDDELSNSLEHYMLVDITPSFLAKVRQHGLLVFVDSDEPVKWEPSNKSGVDVVDDGEGGITAVPTLRVTTPEEWN